MQTESISYLQVEILGLDVNANWKHKLAHVYPLWICVRLLQPFFCCIGLSPIWLRRGKQKLTTAWLVPHLDIQF
jgi:hypothetical protein